jgi:hypothetical protein
MLKGQRSIMQESPSTRPIFASQSDELNFPTIGSQPFGHNNHRHNRHNYHVGSSPYGDQVRHHKHHSGIRSGLNRYLSSA